MLIHCYNIMLLFYLLGVEDIKMEDYKMILEVYFSCEDAKKISEDMCQSCLQYSNSVKNIEKGVILCLVCFRTYDQLKMYFDAATELAAYKDVGDFLVEKRLRLNDLFLIDSYKNPEFIADYSPGFLEAPQKIEDYSEEDTSYLKLEMPLLMPDGDESNYFILYENEGKIIDIFIFINNQNNIIIK